MDIIVNPDEHHILSAKGDHVILLGRNFDRDTADLSACVLLVPRAVYLTAIGAWLDNKAWYGERGEFAGVGNIVFENARKSKARYHLAAHVIDPGDKDWNKMVNAKTFEASEFFIDMEHG